MKFYLQLVNSIPFSMCPVVLYCAGFDWLSGGFISLDIFFIEWTSN